MTCCDDLRFYEIVINELCHIFCFCYFSYDRASYLINVIINKYVCECGDGVVIPMVRILQQVGFVSGVSMTLEPK